MKIGIKLIIGVLQKNECNTKMVETMSLLDTMLEDSKYSEGSFGSGCPKCNSFKYILIGVGDHHSRVDSTSHYTYKCNNCGNIFTI